MSTSFKAKANSPGGCPETIRTTGRLLDFTSKNQSENVAGNRDSSPRLSFGAKYYSGSYSASYHGALLQAAHQLGTPVKDSSARALVSLIDDGKGDRHRLGVELHARLPGVDRVQAQRIMEEAHKICPYSKSLRADTIVRLIVV